MRFKPFLAFRDINSLTHANSMANTNMDEIPNGRVCQLYDSLPQLYMQFNKQVTYVHDPHWYEGIRYRKEKERGFEFREDQMVPGYFEVQMRKGESIIFSAGVSELKPSGLKQLWEKEAERRMAKNDMYSWLKNSASQFYKREGDKCYLLPGYPWYKPNARAEFFAVCACTMGINRPEYWDVIMNKTAVPEVRAFLDGQYDGLRLVDMDEPDSLLWFVYAIQEYTRYADVRDVAAQYGDLVQDIIAFYRKGNHPRARLHHNGLLWVDGTERPATWMSAMENGRPITPRTGYVVEINAYWYNAMCFATELLKAVGNEHLAELMEYQSELTREAFVRTFWNGFYLNDYVVDQYQDKEVRPNQIWAVSLPYSPLDRRQQKAIVDICTKELYTPKGLRTLSPKSGNYRPVYIGGQLERDRNFHNGPVWPSTLSAYGRAYLRVYQHSGESFMRRLLVGFEAEMSELCIGTLNELYDGNPPYKGHGGMSYAPSVAAVLTVFNELRAMEEESAAADNNEQK
jgi:predicted glycogen debranching enzyme